MFVRKINVGVKNGYDEVNVQISAKYKYVFPQQIMLGQENVTTYVPEIKLRSNSIQIKHKPSETYPDQLRIRSSMTIRTRTNQARLLRNYRTCTLSGRYVATELEPNSVPTQQPSVRPARSLRSDRARAKLGHYVATKRPSRSVAMQRPSSSQVRSFRSAKLGCYVGTECPFRSVATQQLSSSQARSLYSD